MASCIPETGHGLRGRVKNKPETESGRRERERERKRGRGAKRKGESRRITDSGNRDFSPSGAGRRVARRRNEDGGKIEGRERITDVKKLRKEE